MWQSYEDSDGNTQWYDDGQPEQADVNTTLAQLQASYPAYEPPSAPASVDNSYYSAGGYTPEEEAYLQKLRDTRAALVAKYPGAEIADPGYLNPIYSQGAYQGDEGSYEPTTTYAPGSEIDAAIAAGASPESLFNNRGYSVRNYGQGTTNQGAYLTPGTKYWLVDNTTGKPLGSGSTPEELQALSAQANDLSASQGKTANWSIVTQGADTQTPTYGDTGEYDEDGNPIQSITGYTSNPNYTTVASDFTDPKKNRGGWLDYVLPILGALAAPFTFGATGALSTALYAGLGSAAGSGLSSAYYHRPLDQALLRAGISGVTAGVGSYAAPTISGALSNVFGSTATNAATNAATNTATNAATNTATNTATNAATNTLINALNAGLNTGYETVVVNGIRMLVPTIGGAVGSAAGSAAGSAINPIKETVNVTGYKTPTQEQIDAGNLAAVTAANAVADAATPKPADPALDENETVHVTADKLKQQEFDDLLNKLYPSAGAALPALGDGIETVHVTGYKTPTQEQIDAGNAEALAAVTASNAAVDAATPKPADPALDGKENVHVTADKLKQQEFDALLDKLYPSAGAVLPALGDGIETVHVTSYKTPTQEQIDAGNLAAVTAANAAADAAAPKPADPAAKPTTLSDYLKYASLGLTAAGLLGGGGGGSGSGAGGGGTGVYQAPNALPDIFHAKLPDPSGKSTTGPWAPDTNKPWGANDPGAGGQNLGKEDWYRYGFGPEKSFFKYVPGTPIGLAKGGSLSVQRPAPSAQSLAVKGPGDGRSDDINAKLSDGEYVMDAETVAMLGNGSNKAGADALDRFRVNVRKHKGKSLAAGRFSVNAKQPETYLKGRG